MNDNNNFIKCSNCDCLYDSTLDICPQCGHKRISKQKIIMIIFATLIFIDLTGFLYLLKYDNPFEGEPKQPVTEQSSFSSKSDDKPVNEPDNIEDGVDFGNYMRNVQKKIKSNWNPPKGNESKRVVLFFKITKNGDISEYSVKDSSGVPEVDEAAIEALKASAPFDKLPENYKKESVDVQFTFDYNVFKK